MSHFPDVEMSEAGRIKQGTSINGPLEHPEQALEEYYRASLDQVDKVLDSLYNTKHSTELKITKFERTRSSLVSGLNQLQKLQEQASQPVPATAQVEQSGRTISNSRY